MNTNKSKNVASVLHAGSHFIRTLIWLAVVIIILATAGKFLWKRQQPQHDKPQNAPVPVAQTDWSQVDHEIVEALKQAHQAAETSAQAKLDAWTDSLMKRVDNDFLEWYFSYWTQQVLGLKAMWYWTAHELAINKPGLAEQITQDVQEQFAQRVLRPEIAQLELERISHEVLQVYVDNLTTKLAAIPTKYKIPQTDWERYLSDIAVMTSRTEGNREVSLTLKTVVASGVTGGAVLAKAMAPALKEIGGKVMAKLAGKAAGEVAAKTGGKVAAKVGGKMLGEIVGIGIIIWDVWDHYQTKKVDRPILRQNIADYFTEVKQHLLHEPDSGIITVIDTIEHNIVSSLRTKPSA